MSFNGGDPTVAANWTELAGPLFQGTASNGNYGTAVCSPFLSPDGLQTWFCLRRLQFVGDYTPRSGISAHQQLSWNSDGTPEPGQGHFAGASRSPILPPMQPSAPANFTATAGNNQATLSWPTNSADLSYNIKRSASTNAAARSSYSPTSPLLLTTPTSTASNAAPPITYVVSGFEQHRAKAARIPPPSRCLSPMQPAGRHPVF